jgi:hypothetical protein
MTGRGACDRSARPSPSAILESAVFVDALRLGSYAAADTLPLVGTEAIVFRICEAIW